ncbi:MAG: hypothetical protein KIH10_17725 [Candidatus Freyarchaeota archaeon]|nr:hypothetical protein [Candidatus Jordarchaeia archaeon]
MRRFSRIPSNFYYCAVCWTVIYRQRSAGLISIGEGDSRLPLCPDCGKPASRKMGYEHAYECRNPQCPVIEITRGRVTRDSLKWKRGGIEAD